MCDSGDRKVARNSGLTLLELEEAVQTIPHDLLVLLADSNGFEGQRIDEITTRLGF
jgi:hypothetical protein